MIKRLVLLLAAGLSTTALAQSINIDLGVPGTAPPDGYGAAGMPGARNKFEAVDTHITYPLFDLHGNPTGATLHQIGGTEIRDAALGGPGDPTGSDAVLLKDTLVTHTTVENCLFINSLTPGTYEVRSYAWMPDEPTIMSNVHIDTNPTSTLVGGGWPGLQREGVTFASISCR